MMLCGPRAQKSLKMNGFFRCYLRSVWQYGAKTVALHLGAVPEAMTVVLDNYSDDLLPGDAVILNDPYQGGMHLPDIFMFMPVFPDGTLQGFTVCNMSSHGC